MYIIISHCAKGQDGRYWNAPHSSIRLSRFFLRCNSEDALLYFLKTLQAGALCPGGVLYSFYIDGMLREFFMNFWKMPIHFTVHFTVWPAGHYVSGLSFRPSFHHALGVPLCVQRPAKALPFQLIIMHALQCQHDLDVHLLFCFHHDLHITSSRGHI